MSFDPVTNNSTEPVPTLQQLGRAEELPELTRLHWMALLHSAGYTVTAPRRNGKNQVWQDLLHWDLLHTDGKPTYLGKMAIVKLIEKNKKEKEERKEKKKK